MEFVQAVHGVDGDTYRAITGTYAPFFISHLKELRIATCRESFGTSYTIVDGMKVTESRVHVCTTPGELS